MWCQRNFQNFAAVSGARKSDYRIIGLSTTTEGLEKYVNEKGIQYPIYANPDPIKNRDLIASGTPATVLIQPDGKIGEVWLGAYDGRTKSDVEAKLNVRLPGLVPGEH